MTKAQIKDQLEKLVEAEKAQQVMLSPMGDHPVARKNLVISEGRQRGLEVALETIEALTEIHPLLLRVRAGGQLAELTGTTEDGNLTALKLPTPITLTTGTFFIQIEVTK